MSNITHPGRVSEGATAAADQIRPAGVLVIEDEPLLLRTLEKGLRKRGLAVWAAADGGEGVELYGRFGGRIDIVLSDFNMPVMDGPQTLDALRAINPSVRFCFMTGDVRLATLTRLLKLGALRVFAKPFPSVAEVAEGLRGLAARPPGDPASLGPGGEGIGHDDTASSGPLETLAGGGLFGTVFPPVRPAACVGLPWGKRLAQPPGGPPRA